MSRYLLQSFELPMPSSGSQLVFRVPIDPPEGYRLHSTLGASGELADKTRAYAGVLWERVGGDPLSEERREKLRVLLGYDSGGSGPETPKFSEPTVTWRGSVTDLVRDLEGILSMKELFELSIEAERVWGKRRRGEPR